MIRACKATHNGATVVYASIDDALESMKYDLQETEPGKRVEISIEVVEMTEEEYAAMPEFDGF